MVNILPPDSLKTVRHFYRSRVILAGSLVAIACGVIVLVSLISAYAVVIGTPIGVDDSPDVTLSASSRENREAIVHTETLLKELGPLAVSASSTVEFIEAALLARPHSVAVQNIHLTRTDPATLILAGTASSRDDINAYRVTLSKDSRFKSVSVPIGILAGTKDDRFIVTLTGDF